MIIPRQRPDEDDRAEVLNIASGLMTGRKDPHIVLPVADHLLNWAADVTRPGTVEHRLLAMRRQYRNIHAPFTQGVSAFEDDPVAFLEAAEQYVPFLSGVTS